MRLIDADETIEANRALAVKNIIDDQPEVATAPEAHGRWEHLDGDEWICTACGHVISTEGSWDFPAAKYCEECGARMDGGEGE